MGEVCSHVFLEPESLPSRPNFQMTQPTLFSPKSSPEWPKVTISTDGGCEPNPGVGRWAAVLRFGSAVKEIHGECRDLPTTNNRAELEAVIHALSALTRSCQVTLRTDSQYAITVAHDRKKRKKLKNADLVAELRAQADRHEINWQWVKGHAGDGDNERADALAAGHDAAFPNIKYRKPPEGKGEADRQAWGIKSAEVHRTLAFRTDLATFDQYWAAFDAGMAKISP